MLVDYARELFKSSKDSVSLLVCNEKNRPFVPGYLALGPTTTRESILLKFSVQTRLKSKSFEPLIGFLMFPLQKLWQKK